MPPWPPRSGNSRSSWRLMAAKGGLAPDEPDAEGPDAELEKIWLRSGQVATYPPQFLLRGERESDVYSEKFLLNAVKDAKLPREASELQGFLEDLLIQIGPIVRIFRAPQMALLRKTIKMTLK